MQNKESETIKEVICFLKTQRWVSCIWRQPNVAPNVNGKYIKFNGKYGVADILGFTTTGKIIAIEVKTNKGVLSVYQKDFLARVNESGGIGLVIKSLGELIEKLVNSNLLENEK